MSEKEMKQLELESKIIDMALRQQALERAASNAIRTISESHEKDRELKERELGARNRVDLSLQEYEALIKERDRYKERSDRADGLMLKMYKRLAGEGMPEEAMRKIFNGECEIEVRNLHVPPFSNPLDPQRYAIIFTLNKEKLK